MASADYFKIYLIGFGVFPKDGLQQKCSTKINFCETYAYHANGNPCYGKQEVKYKNDFNKSFILKRRHVLFTKITRKGWQKCFNKQLPSLPLVKILKLVNVPKN